VGFVVDIKEMDIHRKENSRKSSTYNSRKNSISHKISQYSISATNRIQGTIDYKIQNRKTTAYTETTKHEHKEKATAGNI
jgi:hypothetical protein